MSRRQWCRVPGLAAELRLWSDSEPQFPRLPSGDNHWMHLGRHVKRSEVVPAPSRRSVNGSCHHHDPRSGSSAGGERRFSRKPCEKEGRQAWCSGSLLLRNRPARTWTLEKATGILRICVSVGRLGSAGRFCSWSHLGSLMHLLPDAARGCNRRTAGPLSTPSCSLRASPRSAAGRGTSRAAWRAGSCPPPTASTLASSAGRPNARG